MINIGDINDWEDIKKIVIDVYGIPPNAQQSYNTTEVIHNFFIHSIKEVNWFEVDPTSYTKEFVEYIEKNFNQKPKEVKDGGGIKTVLTFERLRDTKHMPS